MIDRSTVTAVIDTYAKHGWTLRRVLLSAADEADLGHDVKDLFGEVPIDRADSNAAWFSRPQQTGMTAWELRYLGPTQYALVAVINEDDDNAEVLSRTERELFEKVSKLASSH